MYLSKCCYKHVQCFLAFIIFLQYEIQSERTKSDVEGIFKDLKAIRTGKKWHHLSGRERDMDEFSRRHSNLPPGFIFREDNAEPLKCGKSYDIAYERQKFWRMNSPKKVCYHEFIGSRMDNCTVGVLCSGPIEFDGNANGHCKREYLKLYDGTCGHMVGCGRFTFSNKPRCARNNGMDMYVYFRGASWMPCVSLCIEDLKPANDVDPPRKIVRNKKFQGLKMESKCKCRIRRDNKIEGRIVGGHPAHLNEFPWQVAIVWQGYPEYKRVSFCGGSLINDRYILTAAHCFAPSRVEPWDIEVVLHANVMDFFIESGTTKYDEIYKTVPGWGLPVETDESEKSIRVEVEEIINHPFFSMPSFDWDVALLKLTKKINLANLKVAPICLPQINEVINYTKGDYHVVSGWGRFKENFEVGSRILQKLEVPYVERSNCKKYTFPSKRHICAGYLTGEADACAGDSGGPLVYKFKPETNQYILTGITSAGEGCARKNKYGIYTNTMGNQTDVINVFN